MTDGPSSRQRGVAELIRRFAAEQHLDLETGTRPGELVLSLPGEKKLKTVCSIVIGDQDLVLGAFVIRNPDENHEVIYRHLLRRNLRMPGLAYAVDATGDIYVVSHVPLAGVDEEYLDRLLGVVLEAADASFNELLTMGFLTSMRREWAWRVSRNESLRNLEAFRSLLEGSEHDPDLQMGPAPQEETDPQRPSSSGDDPAQAPAP